MKKSFINTIVLLFVVIFSVVEINAQKGFEEEEGNESVSISGSQAVYQNEVKTYSAIPSAGLSIYNATWLVSGGTIQSQNNFSVTVLWTTVGNQTIDYEVTSSNVGNLITDYAVLVSAAAAPPAPSAPTILSQSCNSATLQKAGNPPSGITWYWQGTNSSGTSTINNATSNYAATSSGTYYIRARNASGTWSASSASVQVVLGTVGGTTWYQDLDGDGLGDPAVTTVSCTKPSGYVSNNSDQCPTANGNGSSDGCPAVNVFGNENYVYSITPQTAMTSLPSNTNTSDFVKSITYFDGLGRAKQSIGIRQSASQRDIVTHMEYNSLGQQEKEYLPYVPTATGDGQIKTGAKVATESYYNTATYGNTTNPYSEKTIEASPLARVFEQGAPGNDWKIGSTFSSKGYSNNSHTIKFEYDTNTGTEVKEFKATTVYNTSEKYFEPSLQVSGVNNGYYAAGMLIKTVTKDENWTSGLAHTTEEFKNKNGQVVLKRTYGKVGAGTTIEAHDTYYVYDKKGNLTYVLPPEMDTATAETSDLLTKVINYLDDLGYQYKYDYRNRLIEKKIPGKGWEYIVYDNLDRPVLTQDANQRDKDNDGSITDKDWLFTKYDALGRVVYTGIYTHNSVLDQQQMQSHFDNQNNTAVKYYETKFNSPGDFGIYYSESNFPKLNIEILTINYYDDYVFERAGLGLPSSIGTVYGTTITTNTKGLSTGSKIRILGTNDWITTVTYYDEKAQPIYVYSHNTMHNTTDIVQSKLDFTGKVLETKATHTKSNGNHATQNIRDVFTYDHAGRLLTQIQYLNGATTGEMIVENSYDELGQLKKKHVGGGEMQTGYKDLVGVSVSGDMITKTAANGWNASIKTQGSFSGDGAVEYTVVDNNQLIHVGLSPVNNSNLPNRWDTIHYSIYTAGPNFFYISHSGVNEQIGNYNIGDVFSVERIGTTVYFKRNGVAFRTSSIPSSGEMLGEMIFYNSGKRAKNFKIINNSKGLQTVDYTYNVRGWLQSINQDANNDNDLFNFGIKYNNPTTGTALYNGNISQTSWSTLSADTSTKTYTYSYDALNRIKTAINTSANYNLNLVTYDKNGNILSLKRQGHTNSGATSFGVMDDLSYSYTGNRLKAVSDTGDVTFGFKNGANLATEYTYDLNGNMKTDQNKGITAISYNHLNLPTQVTINGQTISYTYDAAGTKLRKVVNGTTTDYAGNYIYNNNNLQFFNTPEGYFNVTSTSGTVQGDYVYQYKDHLGNVRLSYSDTNNDGAITPATEIIEESNYYPFGLKHKGYNNVISSNGNSTAQKFGYSGKELNEELGLEWHDFGARNYDASLGRWMNLDPLAHEMPDQSPYNYAFNNPIYFVDPDGQKPCPSGDCGGVVAVFFHGGPFGGGKQTTADKAGGTGEIYKNTQATANAAGRQFKGTIIAPGLTSGSGVSTATEFIKENFSSGDQVIIYGYSYGADVAVELAAELAELGIEVDLLVTVDGSDGPLQNVTVDDEITDNVDTNLNVYQTDDSGSSSSSRSSGSSSSGSSGSSSSDSGSSNSPGSNGGKNKAKNKKKTNVINKNVTGKGVNHGNIQQKAKNIIQPLINTRIYNYDKSKVE